MNPIWARLLELEYLAREPSNQYLAGTMAQIQYVDDLIQDAIQANNELLKFVDNDITLRHNSISVCVGILDDELKNEDSWVQKLPDLLKWNSISSQFLEIQNLAV